MFFLFFSIVIERNWNSDGKLLTPPTSNQNENQSVNVVTVQKNYF